MARTPKSERRYNKASAAADRATQASYAHLYEDDHPAHKQQCRALDRESRALARTNLDYRRHVRRDMDTISRYQSYDSGR